jgi:hypothetical protein
MTTEELIAAVSQSNQSSRVLRMLLLPKMEALPPPVVPGAVRMAKLGQMKKTSEMWMQASEIWSPGDLFLHPLSSGNPRLPRT